MQENKLDKRIERVLQEVGKCRTLVDVGTDHGNLAIYAKKNNIAEKVIATDIRENIILKLENKIKTLNLDIETRVSDGFKNLNNNEFDVVCVLGVGGLNIINMLQNEKRIFNRYFFVPHQNIIELRKYLMDNNFKILKDFVVKSLEKHYFILEVIKTDKINPLKEEELYFGKDNLLNLDFISYKETILKSLNTKLNQTKNEKYIEKLKKEISLLETIK